MYWCLIYADLLPDAADSFPPPSFYGLMQAWTWAKPPPDLLLRALFRHLIHDSFRRDSIFLFLFALPFLLYVRSLLAGPTAWMGARRPALSLQFFSSAKPSHPDPSFSLLPPDLLLSFTTDFPLLSQIPKRGRLTYSLAFFRSSGRQILRSAQPPTCPFPLFCVSPSHWITPHPGFLAPFLLLLPPAFWIQ